MDFPHLSRLYICNFIFTLGGNCISNLQDFAKLYHENLKFVSFGGNRIENLDSLSNVFLPSIDTLRMEYEKSLYHSHNFNWIAKFEANFLYELCISFLT